MDFGASAPHRHRTGWWASRIPRQSIAGEQKALHHTGTYHRGASAGDDGKRNAEGNADQCGVPRLSEKEQHAHQYRHVHAGQRQRVVDPGVLEGGFVGDGKAGAVAGGEGMA